MIANNTERLKWKLIIIMISAYIATNINLQGFMALLPFIKEDLTLSRTQIGLYSTFFFAGATLLGILTGRYADILGAKKGMIIGVSCVGVLMLFHSLVPGLFFLLLFAFLSGIAFSLVAPSVNKGITIYIPAEKRAVSLGIVQTGVGIGGFLGASFLPVLGKSFGWRTAVLFPGIAALIIAFAILKFIPDISLSNFSRDKQESSFKSTIFVLINNKKLLNLSFIGFIFAGINSFIITHFTIFLNYDLGFSKTTAGLGLGILQIGGLMGQPGWGWLNEKIFSVSRGRGILIMGLSITFFTFFFGFFIYSFKFPLFFIYLMIYLLGFSTLGWMGFHLISVSETVRKDKTGTAIALVLIFVRFGLLLSPPIFGYLSDIMGNYRLSWIILSFIALIATFLFSLREKLTLNK